MVAGPTIAVTPFVTPGEHHRHTLRLKQFSGGENYDAASRTLKGAGPRWLKLTGGTRLRQKRRIASSHDVHFAIKGMVVLRRRHKRNESSGRLGLRGQRRERQQCDDGSDGVSYHSG